LWKTSGRSDPDIESPVTCNNQILSRVAAMMTKEPTKPSLLNRILQIKETCIYAADLEKMKDFYAGKLGLKVISHVPGKHIFFKAGTSVLLCFNPEDSRNKTSPPAHYASGKYHFAFEVQPRDYEWQKNEIIRHGILITDEVSWQSGQKSFYFEDPAGNVLEIVPVGIW
jgi:catechol 2,3-dioxygenase-like lactoylglutathione lyase family enzyme